MPDANYVSANGRTTNLLNLSCAFAGAVLAGFLLTATLACAEQPRFTDELQGKVVSVADGDTVTVLVNKEQVRVRLDGIDAPESNQSFGARAKQALSGLVFGKTVTIKKTGTDRFGRTLGVIMVGDLDANAKMIEDGWAWHYKQYNQENRLAQLEDAARQAKRGFWADPAPLAPWEFRARQRTPGPVPETSDGSPLAYWLNVSSGVRHNSTCEHFGQTKRGRSCGPDEGRPCGKCGG
ncbi:MAG TPA: nuclease [Planctomycetaceae bacterium]|nr:nuclease [Planctomycetaceae bacterium]